MDVLTVSAANIKRIEKMHCRALPTDIMINMHRSTETKEKKTILLKNNKKLTQVLMLCTFLYIFWRSLELNTFVSNYAISN